MLKNEKIGLTKESEENKTLIIKSKIKVYRGIMLEYIEKLVEKYGQDPWNAADMDYKMMELAREKLEMWQSRIRVCKSIDVKHDVTKHYTYRAELKNANSIEKKIIKLLAKGKGLAATARGAHTTQSVVLEVAHKRNLKVNFLFHFCLVDINDIRPNFYSSELKSLAREMHIAPCKLTKILAENDVEILKKRGYKLWQGNFGWQHMPIGSLFTTSQKDCIRCKKGETFSESEVVGV